MKTSSVQLIAALGLVVGLTSPVRAQPACSTGVEYSTGKYGMASATDMTVWYLAPEYSFGSWTAALFVPHLRVSGPPGAIVIAGRPRLERYLNARAQQRTRTDSGVGDLVASVAYRFDHYVSPPWSLSASAAATLPTGDEEKGLGTGERDYDVSLDAERSFGRAALFAGAGHRFVGRPDGSDVCNYSYGRVGVRYWMTDAVNVAMHWELSGRSVKSQGADSSAGLGLNWQFTRFWSAEAHVLTGFTRSASDWAGGVSLRLSY